MSIEAYKAAWATDCTGGVKLTLLAIAEFASAKNGYTCCASVETLAGLVGTKPRQIERNIRELESAGIVETAVNRGRGNTNVYSIAHIIKPVTQDVKPVTDDTFYEQEYLSQMTGINGENPSSRTQNPSSRTIKPVMDDTQTIYNPNNHIYIPPDPEPIAAIKTALSITTKTPLWASTEEEYDQAAHLIMGYDCNGDDVKAFGEWWKTNSYYNKPGKPYLKSLVSSFPDFLESRNGHKNGAAQPIHDPQFEAMLKELEVKDVIKR